MTDILTGISYTEKLVPGAVTVVMDIGPSGEAVGMINVPGDVALQMPYLGFPATDEPILLALSISYALLIALHYRLPLLLSGKRHAWNGEWGRLPEFGGSNASIAKT